MGSPERAIPKSQVSTTSASSTGFTVPAGKRWKLWGAFSRNSTRTTAHYVYARDASLNNVGQIAVDTTSVNVALWEMFNPCILDAAMSVLIDTGTFVAGDTIDRGILYEEWDA